MKDMIKRVREEREGFTLAELLIVVAIIAVLVAIAIPVFNSQLEKSREAVDLSNIRAAYAECSAAVLSGDGVDTTDGSKSEDVTLEQTEKGWKGDNANVKIAGKTLTDLGINELDPATNKVVTVKVAKDGALTVTPKTSA